MYGGSCLMNNEMLPGNSRSTIGRGRDSAAIPMALSSRRYIFLALSNGFVSCYSVKCKKVNRSLVEYSAP